MDLRGVNLHYTYEKAESIREVKNFIRIFPSEAGEKALRSYRRYWMAFILVFTMYAATLFVQGVKGEEIVEAINEMWPKKNGCTRKALRFKICIL